MSTASPVELVRPGSVVVFDTDTKGGHPALGLVMDRVGKKKSMYTVKLAATAAAGGTGSVAVALRQVRYVLPGGSDYMADDLAGFEAQTPIDESLLEDAWEMLIEEGAAAPVVGNSAADCTAGTSDPRGMAQLLLGVAEPTPQECYQAFRLLEGRGGVLRFKRRRDGTYECRTRYGNMACDHRVAYEMIKKVYALVVFGARPPLPACRCACGQT